MARLCAGAFAFVLAARLASAAAAQDLDSAEAARCGLIGRRAQVTDTLYAVIPSLSPGESNEEHAFRVAQLRAVLRTFGPPVRLGREDSARAAARLANTASPRATLLLWFQVRNDGHLSGLALEQPSPWREFDLQMARAVIRSDSFGQLLPLPPALRDQAIDLRVDVRPGGPMGIGERIPVGAIVRTVFKYDTGGRTITGPRLIRVDQPRFPDVARQIGIGDSLLFEFDIDTLGRARNVRLLQAGFREFAESALQAVGSAQFEPGRIGDCKVSSHVIQPIRFLFRRR